MANFNSFKITDSGLDLQYKAQIGNTLEFSKFVLGDGYYTGSIRELNQLVNPIREEPITRFTVSGTGSSKKLVIGFDLETKNITTGFYLREIGIYAKDPDTNEDVLMFYTNAGETADYIASNASDNVSAKLINGELYISDIEEITAIIDNSLVYATKQELTEIESNIEEIESNIEEITAELNGLHRVATSGNYNDLNNIPIRNDIPYVYLYDDGRGASDNLTEDGIYRIKTLSVNSVLNSMFTNAIIHRYIGGNGSTFIMILASSNKDLNNYGYYGVSKTNGVWNIEYSKIPTKTSELTNDSGFKKITASTTDLTPGVSALATGEIHLTYE